MPLVISVPLEMRLNNPNRIARVARPGRSEQDNPKRDPHHTGDDEHGVQARGLAAARSGEHFDEAA
jgi:hypothetical protein